LDRLNASAVFQHLAGCTVTESLRLAGVLTASEYAELSDAGRKVLVTAATRARVQRIRLAAMARTEAERVEEFTPELQIFPRV